MFSLTLGSIALIAFVSAGVLSLLRAAPAVRPWLYLIAGLGVGGVIADLIAQGAEGALGVFATFARMMFGTTAGLAIVIGLSIYLAYKMRPKGGSPTKLTNFSAFVFPAILAAAGLTALVNLAGNGVTTAAGAIGVLLNDLINTF